MPLPPEIRPVIRRLEVTSRRLLAGALTGEYRSHFRGRGMEFSEIRPYQAGDDIRQMDWNVTARTGSPHVRLYREERGRTLIMLADLSPSCNAAKRELLVRTAALLAFAAVHNRDRLALVAFSDRVEELVPPGAGRNHALRILGVLLTLQAEGKGTDLRPPLEAAQGLGRRPGMIILLSDFHAPLPERLLRRVNARHDVLAFCLRDCREETFPAGGLVLVGDPESGRKRLLDIDSERSRLKLAQSWRQTDRELATALRRMGIDHAVLRSDAAPLPVLLSLFRSRLRRRG